MSWDQLEGSWEHAKTTLKSRWAKLTDDDLHTAAARRDELVGKLQQRYGLLKDDAERQIDDWMKTFEASVDDGKKLAERAGDGAKELEDKAEKKLSELRGRAEALRQEAAERAGVVTDWGKNAARFVENVTSSPPVRHDRDAHAPTRAQTKHTEP